MACNLDTKEVVNALQSLTHDQAKELFFQLGVELHVLDNIDSDHKGNMRKIHIVQEWLNIQHGPTWEKIVAGLAKIGLHVLAVSVAASHDVPTPTTTRSNSLTADPTCPSTSTWVQNDVQSPVVAKSTLQHHTASTHMKSQDQQPEHDSRIPVGPYSARHEVEESDGKDTHQEQERHFSRSNTVPRDYSSHWHSPPRGRHLSCPSSPPEEHRFSRWNSVPRDYSRSPPPRAQGRHLSCPSSLPEERRLTHWNSVPRDHCRSPPPKARGRHLSCPSSPPEERRLTHWNSAPRGYCHSPPPRGRHLSCPSSPPRKRHFSPIGYNFSPTFTQRHEPLPRAHSASSTYHYLSSSSSSLEDGLNSHSTGTLPRPPSLRPEPKLHFPQPPSLSPLPRTHSTSDIPSYSASNTYCYLSSSSSSLEDGLNHSTGILPHPPSLRPEPKSHFRLPRPPSLSKHDYHHRSHGPGHPGSHDHHMISHPGSRDSHSYVAMEQRTNEVCSPELEKAKVITLSSGSSEEELTTINSEGPLEGSEETDRVYFPQKRYILPPGGSVEGPHAQLSQPTYLSKAPPTSSSHTGFPRNPASYPSFSQPYPPHSYDTRGHIEGQFGPYTASHAMAGGSYDVSKKGHPLPPSQHHPKHASHSHHQHQSHYRTHPNQALPPPHDYHHKSHDHHTTGHPGSHDHHMTGHPGSHDLAHAAMEQQYRGHRQQGHAHPQPRRMEHNLPVITKQNLLKAHEAAAAGDLTTLRHMLVSHEIDGLCMDDTGLTLAHTAAMTNNLSVIITLVNDGGLPLQALQLPDENIVSPAMVAIQWLVEEGKVPLVVKDAGGHTLLHHAAHHSQVNCLQWLLKATKPAKYFLDNFGVTPAHFAAQQGHLECLQVMIDHNYSVSTPDKENQKPIDWADAMGHTVCVRYLFMHESCWELSAEVSHLSKQLDLKRKKTRRLRKENVSLKEKLSSQEQEYHHHLSKIQTHHEERIMKMREQYVDLTASLLQNK